MSTPKPRKRTRREYEAPDLQAASRRMMRALVRRAEGGELEALEALVALQADLAAALQDGVTGYRQGPAQASWADVARATGTTRQAAAMRFGKALSEADVEASRQAVIQAVGA